MKSYPIKIAKVASISVFLFLAACAKPTEKPKPKVEEVVVQPPPQCISGCMPNEDDKCVIEARVADGATLESEIVECDPRCCEPGATFIGGGVDTDKDGIYDGADECVDQAEDYDGYQDKDGCPEVDNDNDKILDGDDLCPLDPENVNGVDDEDGCPD